MASKRTVDRRSDTRREADPDSALLRAAAAIRLLVLDVDGVLTDGRLHYDADGRECKSFHVRDGFGLQQVMEAGIEIAVISGRRSRAAATRMAELGIRHVLLGRNDKLAAFEDLAAQLQIPSEHVACMGDDVPDLPTMQRVALPVAVADAHPRVLAAARWRTRLPGGAGAVRELCDLLLAARAA
jgi:3-deoxy-D-manno-octulosonate 8-phosphate phosphatase (KDO 8-P phosphatase)